MKPIFFEKRELVPHAEPVSARDLKEGAIYFFVNFADDAMLIPTMEPMVFVGRNLEINDVGLVYFQDLDSYHLGARHDSADNESATFYAGPEDQTNHIFEYECALEELMRCLLRRKKA